MEKIEVILAKNLKDNELYYCVNFGGIIKSFKNERNLNRFMESMGYDWEFEGENAGLWVKKYLSQDEINFKKNYDKNLRQFINII